MAADARCGWPFECSNVTASKYLIVIVILERAEPHFTLLGWWCPARIASQLINFSEAGLPLEHGPGHFVQLEGVGRLACQALVDLAGLLCAQRTHMDHGREPPWTLNGLVHVLTLCVRSSDNSHVQELPQDTVAQVQD